MLWFKRKLYGWGWTPITWQGWLIVGLYLAGLVAIFRRVDAQSHSASDTLLGVFFPVIGLTVLLVAICLAKGERPRWQWGKERE